MAPSWAVKDGPKRWHAEPENQAHKEVVAIADALWSDDTGRRNRYQRSLEQYEGRKLPGLHASAYGKSERLTGDGWDQLYWNVTRLLCKTAQAKIAGRQKPKAQFVASNADWSTKRRARKLDRFVEAQMMQPQDGHEDVWAVAVRAFLDAVVLEPGFIKVYADHEDNRVALERVLPWRILVDSCETETGQPTNMFHLQPWDRDLLAATYPEHKAAVMAATADDEQTWGRGARVADRVKVYEAWRLPMGKTPGRWVRCIDSVTLEDRPWTRREFPFIRIDWTRELIGYWGCSLVEEVESIADEVNYSVARLREAEHLTPKAVCIYEQGSVDDEHLRSNEDCINIPYRTGTVPPTWHSPKPFDESSLGWLRLNWEKAFELCAISQQSATARKEPGVNAAVAMRTLQDMQSEVFSVVDRAYQGVFPALARHIVACTRELAEQRKDFAVRWPGGKFLQEIKWDEADLPEDQYVIQLHGVSEMKNTPADRLQLAQELNAGGKLSDAALMRVIQYLDTPAEFGGQNKQRELIGHYIETWLDATLESIDAGSRGEPGGFKYYGPIPIGLNHEDAIVQVAEEYLDAQLNGAPDLNLDFFLRFITECDKHIQTKAQKLAQIQAMAQGQAPAPPAGGPMPAGPIPMPVPGMAA